VSVNSFSTFYFASSFGSESTLPVTFIDVSASLEKNHVEVKWQTAHEREVLWYDVERSADGINFNSIGQIEAKNNNSEEQKYSFNDITALQEGLPKMFYRIRETGVY